MTARYFDDFKPGDRFESAGKTLPESEILDFAWRYDPQPIHMDKPRRTPDPMAGSSPAAFRRWSSASGCCGRPTC